MSRKGLLLLFVGLAIFLLASGIYIFKNGFYSFWDSDVKRIDSQKAKMILSQESPILIDARTPEEFLVSHLKGSIRYEDGIIQNLPKDQPILIYCTLGVRSNRVAKQLSDQGYKVYDMKDGIIGWVNNEFPLVDSDGLTTQNVHTYSKNFSSLLKKGTAVY